MRVNILLGVAVSSSLLYALSALPVRLNLISSTVGNFSQSSVAQSSSVAHRVADIPLVIVGEGGTSRSLFQYAADTYIREHGGIKYTVNDGDTFVHVLRSFVRDHGRIFQFVYFGHGNGVGLYVNQEPGVNGGIYVNDPAYNEPFRAASIYDLPRTLFAPSAHATFYGCSVADETVENDSFAEHFAHHFSVETIAATGPTEFTSSKNARSPVNQQDAANGGAVYMIPSWPDKGFVTHTPSMLISEYDDVSASFDESSVIAALTEQGLTLDGGTSFLPYKNTSNADAIAFCRLLNEDCTVVGDSHELIRNTAALKLLLDAAGYKLKKSGEAYEAQIRFAQERNLLPPRFIHKRWLTRGEMAMLTWNVQQLD